MGLRLKFNLVLLATFVIALVVSGSISYELLRRNAEDEVVRSAGMMMETALAIRGYTISQVRPLLEAAPSEGFLPQTVPAFAATETLGTLRAKYPDFTYREATLNPTNPRNTAIDWERDLIERFRQGTASGELTGQRPTGTGSALYVARPIKVGNSACLTCHSTPQEAPALMLDRYGPRHGFGWRLDEVVGAQIVSVPMDLPINNARRVFATFMGSLVAVFASLFLILNVMLSMLIVRPLSRMSRAAEQVSIGDFTVAEFSDRGRDEVARLGQAFNRMRRSLRKAMQIIERR
jgi:methyl-accepting chemotaxis protein